jgi:hypothetical protein
VVQSRVISGFGGGEVWLKVGPLGIGEVSEACCSHEQKGTEPLSQNSFSEGFLEHSTPGWTRKCRRSHTAFRGDLYLRASTTN